MNLRAVGTDRALDGEHQFRTRAVEASAATDGKNGSKGRAVVTRGAGSTGIQAIVTAEATRRAVEAMNKSGGVGVGSLIASSAPNGAVIGREVAFRAGRALCSIRTGARRAGRASWTFRRFQKLDLVSFLHFK